MDRGPRARSTRPRRLHLRRLSVAVAHLVADRTAQTYTTRVTTSQRQHLHFRYNGAAFVAAKLESLASARLPRGKLEILVFSDGSNDATEALVREFAQADPRIFLLSSPERKGKPAAAIACAEAATGEVW